MYATLCTWAEIRRSKYGVIGATENIMSKVTYEHINKKNRTEVTLS